MSSAGPIESLKKSAKKRDELIEILAMWDKVTEQGIEPDDVARFALETKFMNARQLRDFRALKFAKDGKPVTLPDGNQRCIPSHANAVRMKDGSTVELNPWVELP